MLGRSAEETRDLLQSLVKAELVRRYRNDQYRWIPGVFGYFPEDDEIEDAATPDYARMEPVVLSFVQKEGSITRSQAAELLDISPREASYLLSRLVNVGTLKIEGERRGASYILDE